MNLVLLYWVNNPEWTCWVNSLNIWFHEKFFPSTDKQLHTCNCSTVSLWAFSILFIFVLKLDSWYWKSAFNSVNLKTQILWRFLELQQDTSSSQYVKSSAKAQESQETLYLFTIAVLTAQHLRSSLKNLYTYFLCRKQP